MDAYTPPQPADGSPAGPNLELDTRFGAMERAAKGKPETQFGDTIEPAQLPDWKEAAATAEELLGETRDLRVLVMLAIARLHLAGLSGYGPVVAGIRSVIETQWDEVHPQLDPEDDNDPMQRANALLLLGDPVQVIRPLRDMPLAGTRQAGFVTWRDIAVLNNAVEAPPDYQRKTEAQVRGLFAATAPEGRALLRDQVQATLAALAGTCEAFDAQSGPGNAPDLGDLMKLLREIGRDLDRYEPGEEAVPSSGPDQTGEGDAEAAGGRRPDGQAAQTRAYASVTAIQSLATRQEALHALDLAASYFRAAEPSSPLPLLIDRAKRLADMPFLEILRDLASDGLQQAEIVLGPSQQ